MLLKLNNSPLPVYLSDEDSDLVKYGWYLDLRGYIQRSNGKHFKKRLHRDVMERVLGRTLLPSEKVDHADQNKLNNIRENLRLATISENTANRFKSSRNSSGYKGVSFHKPTNKWRAYITKDSKGTSLGLHTSPEEAARAYDRACLTLYGEFSPRQLQRSIVHWH